jgi:hypothetical protein
MENGIHLNKFREKNYFIICPSINIIFFIIKKKSIVSLFVWLNLEM